MSELKKTIYNGIYNYKGYTLTKHGTGYFVFIGGDEIYFDSLKDVKNYIDRLEVIH